MIIRYDFGEKLDLSRFEKQLPYYVGSMPELTYHIVMKSFRLEIDIITTDPIADNGTKYMATIMLSEIWRDPEGEISRTTAIVPLMDSRFADIEAFKKIFGSDHYKAFVYTNDKREIIDLMMLLTKLLHKINGLLVFI